MPCHLLAVIASDEILERAYAWLCKRRHRYSHNDDVWEVRYRWEAIKPRLQHQLLNGDYRFSPQRRIHRSHDCLEIWSALDSLVLKAIAIVLTKHLAPQLSKRCTHLAGNGGAKAAVREVLQHLPENPYVFRTDVKHYYASIRHEILFEQLQQRFTDQRLLDLLWQYLRRTVYDDGFYEDIEQGISLGCPLSPLMGALFLDVLDKRMEASGLFYVRFMDDWVILAPTRWKLRNAVRIVNQTLAELQVEQHPDKTFVGSTNRGFSFLGYEFNADGLTGIAEPTSARFVERIRQLYEQGASVARIGDYIRRWLIWVRSGLDEQVNFGVPALAFSNLANLARLIPHKEMH
jgi:retron-type reverse transcriptase